MIKTKDGLIGSSNWKVQGPVWLQVMAYQGLIQSLQDLLLDVFWLHFLLFLDRLSSNGRKFATTNLYNKFKESQFVRPESRSNKENMKHVRFLKQ